MKYRLVHRTLYEYAAPVTVSHHVARLEPRRTQQQSTEEFNLRISPEPDVRKRRTDYFGNELCFFSIQESHQRLELVSEATVSLEPEDTAGGELSPPWSEVARLFQDPVGPESVEPYQFVFDSPHAAASFALADYARASFEPDTSLIDGAVDLTRRIFEDFKYDQKATTVATPLEEVLEKRRGVCQDFAHLAIACLRSLRLPARYVSGYLRTKPPAGKPRLQGADATHAWFSVFCPTVGWLDFDPTNNLRPGTEHITLGFGRDFDDVSPVAGILTGGGWHEVKVAVDVMEA